jgi:hypothetical protein
VIARSASVAFAVCEQVLHGLLTGALGLTAVVEDALQLRCPIDIQEWIDDAFFIGALLHLALDDASATDVPEGVDDGGHALCFVFGTRSEFRG